MANENKLEDVIRTSFDSIRSMIDANTIIGEPIKTDSGTTIIPISKISVGYASGGTEFNSKKDNQPKNFGGGSGTGLSIAPVAFLTVDKDGKTDIINIGMKPGFDIADQTAEVIDRLPELFGKVKNLFKKKKKDEEFTEEGLGDAPAESDKTV